MNGCLACCQAMVPDLKARRLKLPFDLAFCFDEEVGCSSVRPMIAELAKSLLGFQRLHLMTDRLG